jgi:hypothetical protein
MHRGHGRGSVAGKKSSSDREQLSYCCDILGCVVCNDLRNSRLHSSSGIKSGDVQSTLVLVITKRDNFFFFLNPGILSQSQWVSPWGLLQLCDGSVNQLRAFNKYCITHYIVEDKVRIDLDILLFFLKFNSEVSGTR